MLQLLAAIHAGSTCFMVGLIWFVQVVHYPLLARVAGKEYAAYHSEHARLTTGLVVPVMVVEGATAVLLLALRPPLIPIVWLLTGLMLALMTWTSTAFVQLPAHALLGRSFDPRVHRRLVLGNWLRTFAWSIRGILSLGILYRLAR